MSCTFGLVLIINTIFELSVPTLEGDANEGKSIGYIFSGSSPAGVFSLSDICRTGVKEAMNELKSMGIKTAMLTGDSQAAASYAQEQVNTYFCHTIFPNIDRHH